MVRLSTAWSTVRHVLNLVSTKFSTFKYRLNLVSAKFSTSSTFGTCKYRVPGSCILRCILSSTCRYFNTGPSTCLCLVALLWTCTERSRTVLIQCKSLTYTFSTVLVIHTLMYWYKHAASMVACLSTACSSGTLKYSVFSYRSREMSYQDIPAPAMPSDVYKISCRGI